jgi:hypothetical protein
MHIFIPSTHRAKEVRNGTFKNIRDARYAGNPSPYPVWYVVPGDQVREYADELEKNVPGFANVIACDEKGIAKTRHWIGQWCVKNDITKFLMLDDDLNFIRRKEYDTTKLVQCDNDDLGLMLHYVESMLDVHAHVGISTRQGNNNLAVGIPDDAIEINTRTLRALAYRTDPFMSMQHGRVEVMEDFDVNLQLLEHGYSNCVLAHWAQDQKMTNAPGGCSTYRTQEVQTASAHKLKELHPGFVETRIKQNKTGGEFGTRTEVTIYWKKAYQSGVNKFGKR